MPEIFVYLLKVNLAIVLFYLVYHFLLRRLTFYTLNRFYLLFAFVFSAIYPLVNLREWLTAEEELPVVYTLAPDWTAVMTAVESNTFNVWPYLLGLFWLVVLFFVVRFCLRLLSLWQIHRHSVPARWQYFHFRHVMQKINPFSFWKNIYVHVEAHHEHELADIFNHEQVHVEQLHTADTLLAELYTVLCWFNPAVWLMRYSVRENLEFITDRRVIRSGVDKQAYQYSLLNLGTANAPDGLVSHFNLKHLKTRIMMMNKKKSAFTHLGKYALAVPLIVGLALVFTVSRAYVGNVEGSSLTNLDPEGNVAAVDSSKIKIVVVRESGDGRDSVLQRFEVPGGETLILADPLRPGKQIQINADSVYINQQARSVKLFRNSSDTMLFILDGQPMPSAMREQLDPLDIKAISVLKGQSAVAAYGDRGKNGVTIITSRSSGSPRSGAEGTPREIVVVGKPANVAAKAISGQGVVRRVEGKPMEQEQSLRLRGGKVVGDSLYVEGHAIYRPAADSIVAIHMEDSMERFYAYAQNPRANTPFVLIDGKEGDLSALNPDRIQSIEVIKGDADALREYGPAARNGVIKVVTKK